MTDTHAKLIAILNDLEREIVMPCIVDECCIVTNHLAAVWKARDAINELMAEEVTTTA